MESDKKKIGWLGTGVMGKSMAGWLLKAGHEVHVFNRTKSKTDDLVASGAILSTPEDIAKSCDFVFLMLGYPQDVRDLVLDKDSIVSHMKEGSVLIDHTTSSPSLAVEIHTKCKERKIHSIDAPVSGGDVGAKNGQLVIMCGGDQDSFDLAKPLMDKYAKNCKLMGEAGKGQHTKMANQICVGMNTFGTIECLLYGHKNGLNLDQLIELIGGGAGGSFSLVNLGPRMVKRDFAPGFYVEHFVKDLTILLDEARRCDLGLPGISLVKQFFQCYMAQGGAKNGTQGLITVLEQMNGMKVEKKQ